MALQPGDTLDRGKYRIIRQLGRGGFGFVYLADNTLLHEQVALKELIPALVGDDAMLKRFLAEARATMRLTHERIVRTHDVFAERDNYYIVMEYMAGASLEARLKEHGALPVDEAVHTAADVAEGLACAHEQGVVHCDLKPANILFDSRGRAKVADFGIAYVSDQMLSRSWVTPAGFVAGTLPYMSPEQADGVRNEPRIDIYALGAVLCRMLTGRPYLEFEETDSPRAQARNVQRIEAEQPQPPSSHNRSVPAWLDALVLKALAKRPEERYVSANELLAALARKGAAAAPVPAPVAVAETVVAPPASNPPPPLTPPRSLTPPASQPAPLPKWLWPALGGTAALLLIIVIALIASAAGGGGGRAIVTATRLAVAQATVAPASPMPRLQATAAARPTATGLPPSTTLAPPTETATKEPTFTPTSTATPMPTFTPTSTPSPVLPGRGQGKIAFASDRSGNNEIYVMKSDGTSVRRLTDFSGDDWSPAFSSDGQRLAFTSSRDAQIPGMYNIYVMDINSGNITRLTRNQAWDEYPCWSPDGRQIAFVTTADNNAELFIVSTDGANYRRLTNNPADEHDPAWSPDGRKLAFASKRSGTWQIWIVDLGNGGETQITHSKANDLHPAWSPDGNRIAFFSDRDGNSEIYVMNPAGGEQVRLTQNPARDEHPTWSPDGSAIAFWSNRQAGTILIPR